MKFIGNVLEFKVELALVLWPAVSPLGAAPEDLARAGSMGTSVRDRFLRTRAAVRRVLGLRLGRAGESLRLHATESGKPATEGVEFSLSHSGPYLAVAMADFAVGVDVEVRQPKDAERLARRFFSAADVRALEAMPADERSSLFRRQWVAKEAALKVRGGGLAGQIERAVCVSEGGGLAGVLCGEARYEIREVAFWPDASVAVAWESRPGTARLVLVSDETGSALD